MAPSADRRTFFVGDSSVGDWIVHLAERAEGAGVPITVYDLGVRHDTSDDVVRRWAGEVAVRRVAGSEDRVVVSFGVNDTAADGDGTRVPPDRTVANLRALLDRARRAELPVFVVGPAPVADAEQSRRVAALDARLRASASDVPYVSVVAALARERGWTQARLAELVAPQWLRWLRG